METLATFPRQVAERYGPRQALLHKPGKATEAWTYDELLDRVNRVALWLRERGLRKGDRVILWAPSSPYWVAAYLGSLHIGAIIVPLDVRSGPDFVERVVTQAEPKLALLSKTTKETWGFPIPYHLVEDIASLPESDAQVVQEEVQPDDIAALMFTSGTTGAPKGVILSHGNIIASLEATDKMVPNIRDFRVVSLLPLSHIFEQVVGLLLALKRGSSVYYISSLRPDTIFDALKEHRATAMLLVPAALQLFMSSIEREVAKQGKERQWRFLLKTARFLPTRLRRLLFRQVHERLGGHLEFLVSGGAPIAPELIEKWELLGFPVLQGYGLTEAASVVSVTTMRNRNPYTVGTPIPGLELKLAEDGEVLIKGANVTSGYWRNAEATEQAFEGVPIDNGRWYKTGDLGELDKRGHLRLRGRKKEMIALPSGMNVYPEDVERIVKAIAGIKDAVVVGLSTAQGAEVHAVLILDKEAPADPRNVVREANARLAPHQYIRGVTVWPDEDFPRTHTLKVKKHEVIGAIQGMGKEQAATPPESVASS